MTTGLRFLVSLPPLLPLLGLFYQWFEEPSQNLCWSFETILERFKYRLALSSPSCRHVEGLTQMLPTINLLPITL
jgi:hypothetical protein